MLFGEGSQINVAGLLASSLNVGDATSGGSSNFSGAGTGSVVNRSKITAARGGYVALLGNQVSNEGIISAQLGTVAEVGGSGVTLTFSGNRLLHVEVDRSTLGNLAQNRGLIVADGGAVYMTAGARNSILASSVNNSGVISAMSVQNHNGTIVLEGGEQAGEVTVGGALDVSSTDGTGGEVIATAQNVAVAAAAKINASGAMGGGSIHIGGGWQGGLGLHIGYYSTCE